MISIQKLAASHTKVSNDWVIANLKAIPEDKLDWVPMGKARTALDIAGEMARFALWLDEKIAGKSPVFDDEAAVAAWKKDFRTLDAILGEFERNSNALLSTIENMPDAKLEDTIAFPWNEKEPMTDVIFYHYWNNSYHMGQLCYIQLMLGDTEFHM